MANPATREQLKDYALRSLGAPVIEINVDDDQIDDRIDEALQFYQNYHMDGVERVFLKHKVTNSELIFQAVTTGTFVAQETITGGTSGATGTPTSHDTTPELDAKTSSVTSGDILYVENRKPITRASDQTENIKLIVEF